MLIFSVQRFFFAIWRYILFLLHYICRSVLYIVVVTFWDLRKWLITMLWDKFQEFCHVCERNCSFFETFNKGGKEKFLLSNNLRDITILHVINLFISLLLFELSFYSSQCLFIMSFLFLRIFSRNLFFFSN